MTVKLNATPTRAAGLERLAAFTPHMGRDYAQSRNYDFGPDQRHNISGLSAHVRHRLVLETQLASAAVQQHGEKAAEKFVQEVFWRTYWKGWLEMRPAVWDQYCRERDEARAAVEANNGLLKHYERAVSGAAGIECFDAWVGELKDIGYLHNHARMWFASIWIFTLKLPWALGADFFLRHLIDGDAASNTLSWRWVAGLQTRGKTYAASASNIHKFTDGGFAVEAGQLAQDVEALPWAEPPAPQGLSLTTQYPSEPFTLFLHEEDCAADSFSLPKGAARIAVQAAPAPRGPEPLGDAARAFTQGALDDLFERVSAQAGCPVERVTFEQATNGIDGGGFAAPYICAGPLRDALGGTRQPSSFTQVARAEDVFLWPYATKGFFKFKGAIPSAIKALEL